MVLINDFVYLSALLYDFKKGLLFHTITLFIFYYVIEHRKNKFVLTAVRPTPR